MLMIKLGDVVRASIHGVSTQHNRRLTQNRLTALKHRRDRRALESVDRLSRLLRHTPRPR